MAHILGSLVVRKGEERMKFCEICKVWFPNSKSQQVFHENGLKHKNKVQEKLKQAARNNKLAEKNANKTAEMLAIMEAGAAGSMLRDPNFVKVDVPTEEDIQRMRTFKTIQDEIDKQVGEMVQKEKAEAKKNAKKGIAGIVPVPGTSISVAAINAYNTNIISELVQNADSSGGKKKKIPNYRWAETFAENGKRYFYHLDTQQTSWSEPSEGFLTTEQLTMIYNGEAVVKKSKKSSSIGPVPPLQSIMTEQKKNIKPPEGKVTGQAGFKPIALDSDEESEKRHPKTGLTESQQWWGVKKVSGDVHKNSKERKDLKRKRKDEGDDKQLKVEEDEDELQEKYRLKRKEEKKGDQSWKDEYLIKNELKVAAPNPIGNWKIVNEKKEKIIHTGDGYDWQLPEKSRHLDEQTENRLNKLYDAHDDEKNPFEERLEFAEKTVTSLEDTKKKKKKKEESIIFKKKGAKGNLRMKEE